MNPVARTSLLGRAPVWLLDIDLGGQVVRVATEACSVDTAAGDTVRYQVGLEEPSADDRATSIPLSIVCSVRWAELRARGVVLERAPATLRRWFDDLVLEHAEVILVGELVDVEYGDALEPLEASLVRDPGTSETLWPPADAEIGPDTWPVSASAEGPDLEATPYPTVIGTPGVRGLTSSRPAPGTPAYLVESKWTDVDNYLSGGLLLLADGEVEADQVTVHDLSDGLTDVRSVLSRTDLLGRKVSACNFSTKANENPLLPNPDHEFAVIWDQGGGGVYNELRTGPLRDLGDVLVWWLGRQQRYRVDMAAQRTQIPLLRGFKVDTVITSRVDVIEWVDRELASVFPIVRRDGPGGLFYEADRRVVRPHDLEWWFEVGRNAVRVGGVRARTHKDGLVNDVLLRYAPSVTGGHHGAIRVTGDVDALNTGRRVIIDPACQASLSAHQSRADELETNVIWDDRTAALAAQAYARVRALPTDTIVVDIGPEAASLREGQGGSFTDESLYMSDRYGWIDEIDATASGGTALVVLDSTPSSIPRRTS